MALQYPNPPIAVDYRVAPTPLRLVPVASATALQAALDAAQYGDWIVLTAGLTYQGQFVLGRNGTGGTLAGIGGDNWVTIITSAYANLPPTGTRVSLADQVNMPLLLSTTSNRSNRVIDIAQAPKAPIHHYRLIGLAFTTPKLQFMSGVINLSPSGNANVMVSSNYPDHLAMEHCIVAPDYDYGPFKCITIQGSDITFKDNYCINGMQLAQGDGNLFYNNWGAGPYLIDNNHLEGMGEVLFMGSTSLGGPVIRPGVEYQQPANVTLTNNYIRHPLSANRFLSTYVPPVDTLGVGGVSSVGTTLTFQNAQTFPDYASTPRVFSRVHTTAALAIGATVIDIGTSPVTAGGTLWPAANGTGYLGGTTFFRYTGTTATGFTGVTGITQAWAAGTWVSPRRLFIRPDDNSQPSMSLVDWVSDTQAITQTAFSPAITGVAWRYNKGDFTCKNLIEWKAISRILIAQNVLENGWADGQSGGGGITMTPREGGWHGDIEIRDNKLIRVAASTEGVGDAETSSGFFIASPYATKRVWIHNNLYEHAHDPAIVNGALLTGKRYVIACNINQPPYSFFPIGTMAINDVTVGTGRTVTCSSAVLNTTVKPYVGQIITYRLGGQATVTDIISSTQMTVDVTTQFEASALTPGSTSSTNWFIAPSDMIGFRYQADSWIIEHNTVAGANVNYDFPLYFGFNQGVIWVPYVPALNMVIRNNIFYHGNGAAGIGLSGGLSGFVGNIGFDSTGTNTWGPSLLDSATKQIAKNALFGPNSSSWAKYYGPGEVDMHDPDYLAVSASSQTAVNFVDYQGGNYAVTGKYATDATDGTMRGCDYARLAPIWAAAIAGTTVSSGGSPAAPPAQLALQGGQGRMDLGITPATP